ncbi:sigma factor-like helix-turn-helix DNA-binding protein [Paenibacillus xerothermodurans]
MVISYLRGYSFTETAANTGINPKRVDNALQRAKKKISQIS